MTIREEGYAEGYRDGYSKRDEEIVRCKDCIYCVKEPNGDLCCDVLAIGYEPLGSKSVTEDWFCADGEMKEDRSRKADDTIPCFDDSIGRMPEL